MISFLVEKCTSLKVTQASNVRSNHRGVPEVSDCPIAKFFGECTELKIKLDRCFRREKALKRRTNFEQSKKLKEKLKVLRKETAENDS